MFVFRISLFFIIMCLVIFLITTQTDYVILEENRYVKDITTILWWTPFTGIADNQRSCSLGSCYFTENRKSFFDKESRSHLDAVLFYGSDFTIDDLPLPRSLEWWGLLHEESPKNQPLFNHIEVLQLFNVTSTFKQASGMPLTLQYLEGIESLTSRTYYKTFEEKNSLNLSPVMYLQSDCDPPSERDEFVKVLQKYIPVDSYGSCLQNKYLSSNLRGIESMNDPEILNLISKYKFTLALENSACNDYITEKLWRPLIVGSIPIYWGSQNVEKWLPNENSIIDVRNFSSPQNLALYLYDVLGNRSHYESFLSHKINGDISNTQLIYEVSSREWGVNEEEETKSTFVESFECFVCDKLIEGKMYPKGTSMASLKDYGCPPPETVLTGKPNPSSFWLEQWHKSKVEAKVLSKLIHQPRVNFSIDNFYEEVINILVKENHFKRFLFKEELK